jgi:hypothetical protein
MSHPFRFGAGSAATSSAAEFTENARRIEGLGYSICLVADHFEESWFAAGPALVAVALATTTLRVGSLVYSNSFRHPALLAREAATIDVLSGAGLSSGSAPVTTCRNTARPGYPSSPARPGRATARDPRCGEGPVVGWSAFLQWRALHHHGNGGLAEAASGASSTYTGWLRRPKDARPRRAGGDIVGIIGQSAKGGGLDFGSDTDAVVGEKVSWVREAAGEGFDQLELPP